jgi:predicted O-methyltransferase YrrM/SAM-dependent methyltransferase
VRDCCGLQPHPERERYLSALRYVLARELMLEADVEEVVEPRRFAGGEQEHRRLAPSTQARDYRRQLTERAGAGEGYACVLPRKRGLNPEKNWGKANWERLCGWLHETYDVTVFVLGGEGDTEVLEADHCVSLLNVAEAVKLDVNIAMLEGARFTVASEGGGLFLSLLCGTPTFVFGHEQWRTRVTEEENSLDTPCAYLGRPDNDHTYEEVAEALARFVNGLPLTGAGSEAVAAKPEELAQRVEGELQAEPVLDALLCLPHLGKGDAEREWFRSPSYYPYYAALAAATAPSRVLEVGTRLGYSLAAMLVGFPRMDRIVSVDDESDPAASQRLAEANLRALGYAGESDFLVADGLQALDALGPYERFDLVHLDAHATREQAEEGILKAWGLVAPGGLLLVDDVVYTPSVGSAFRHAVASVRDSGVHIVLDTLRGLGLIWRRCQRPSSVPPGCPTCVLCGSDVLPFAVKGGRDLVHCAECGLVQVAFLDAASRSAWTSLYEDGGRYHRERQMAGHASFVHRYLHDRRLARIRLENLTRHCRRGRLLDVGCSNGAFVRTAEEYGFEAEGIDADEWVVRQGRSMTGCSLLAVPLLGFSPRRKYDVVTLIDTLEHFVEPRASLRKIRRILKAKGWLVIEMPDADEPGFARMGVEWKHLKPAEHAYYFGRGHLEGLLRETGFRLVDAVVPYPDRRVYYARRSPSA